MMLSFKMDITDKDSGLWAILLYYFFWFFFIIGFLLLSILILLRLFYNRVW